MEIRNDPAQRRDRNESSVAKEKVIESLVEERQTSKRVFMYMVAYREEEQREQWRWFLHIPCGGREASSSGTIPTREFYRCNSIDGKTRPELGEQLNRFIIAPVLQAVEERFVGEGRLSRFV